MTYTGVSVAAGNEYGRGEIHRASTMQQGLYRSGDIAYVTDDANSRIVRVRASTGETLSPFRVPAAPPPRAGTMSGLTGDSASGDLYVARDSMVVRLDAASGAVETQWSVPAGDALLSLAWSPTSGRLFAVVAGPQWSGGARVLSYSAAGALIDSWSTTAPGAIPATRGIAALPTGEVAVCSDPGRITIYSSSGSEVRTYPTATSHSCSVAPAPGGGIFVSGNQVTASGPHVVQRYSATGSLLQTLPAASFARAGDRLHLGAIAVDSGGVLWGADQHDPAEPEDREARLVSAAP